ncbi:MAG: carboxypeptidase-like regulatory domain-containing protein, partial [Desulfobacterales bacterium]|nr:carboxypeptidase-like regulatory domain-containing protein [Desulfobacterales bacterium]
MKKTGILLFILILTIGTPLFAGSVSGFISNLEDGEPIHYANVFLENTILGAVSNADGYYIILDVPDGVYTLTASVIGYKLEKRNISVGATSRVKVHFDLTPEQIQMEEVIVSAEREK